MNVRYSKSYTVLFCVAGLLVLWFFLWFCQRAQVILSYNLHLRIKGEQDTVIDINTTVGNTKKPILKQLTLHLVKSLTELGPNLTC